jgi:arginase
MMNNTNNLFWMDKKSHAYPRLRHTHDVSVLGVPLGFGAGKAGVDLAPSAMRAIQLMHRIEVLGYRVEDLGDIPILKPKHTALSDENPKYVHEMLAASEQLAERVYRILEKGAFPVVLGGDHSIAMGTQSGAAAYVHDVEKQALGLLWFDAHADMNTPETSPSGNLHGMPLAILLGYGVDELVRLRGYAPKFLPQYCAHIGARDIDAGERELIRRLGMRCFTMREIDERGMLACMDEALDLVSRAPGGYSVTFDVDSIDPYDAPGSGTLVRGGLTYREAHLAMEKIAETGGMRCLELVEVNPSLDVDNRTAELGVELILSALGKTIL